MAERYNAAADFVDRNLELGRGDKVAVRTFERDYTYAEVAALVNQVGNALLGLGVEIEQRVFMSMPDGIEFPAVFFGAIKIGAVPTPINYLLRPRDHAYALNLCRAKVAVIHASLLPAIREIRPGLHWLKHLVVIGAEAVEAGEIDFADWIASAGRELSPAPTGPDDFCFWGYSSGTTGDPKGIVHLQHDMRFSTDSYAREVLRMTEHDVTFGASKLYFMYGTGMGLFFPFGVGATTLLMPGPPLVSEVMRMVREKRPTIFAAAPTWYANALADPTWKGEDWATVRVGTSAGEALPGSLLRRWKERTGVDLLDGIGSTEALHIFVSNRLDDIQPDCSGTPVPGYEVRLLDDEGNPVPDGEIGMLWVKGDSSFAFYWNLHQKTKETIHGEWIKTGDRYVCRDGHYYYQGRGDDMLKVGGIWVSPIEVEACINSHPSVIESAVVGYRDEHGLVKPEAHVILAPGHQPDDSLAEAIREHVRTHLAHYKCPRRFHFVTELPKTATGKIQRFRLREEV